MISIQFTTASTKDIANAGTAEDGVRTDKPILRRAYTARQYADDVFVRLAAMR